MENGFASKMTDKADSELLDYVTNRSKYKDNEVVAAIIELEQRGKADAEMLDIKNQIAQRVQQYIRQLPLPKKEPDVINGNGIPKSISIAAKLLYLTVGFGVINAILMELETEYKVYSGLTSIATLIITLGFIVFLGSMIGQGRKWARIVFLILFGLGLFALPETIKMSFEINQLTGLITLLQTGFQFLALILLFKKESAVYYRKTR